MRGNGNEQRRGSRDASCAVKAESCQQGDDGAPTTLESLVNGVPVRRHRGCTSGLQELEWGVGETSVRPQPRFVAHGATCVDAAPASTRSPP